MKVKEVLNGIECEILGNEDVEVLGLSHNSKKVKEGYLFFAINGTTSNGEEFVLEAINGGARVIVSEKPILGYETICNVVVENVRKAMSLCAINFYKNPSKSMLIVGVTGTNGKTTTTYMLKNIFEKAGRKVGVIGTNGIVINNEKYPNNLTTPDPIDLQKNLALMKEKGVNVVFMEVSAHALQLQKIWGLMSDIALFTNLSQDHLDFFENMEKYYKAKERFFTKEFSRFGVVNVDDEYGKRIFENSDIPLISYSRKKLVDLCQADIFAFNEKHNNSIQEFDVETMKGRFHIKMNILGGFNISNALGAIAVALMSGINIQVIVKAFSDMNKIEGRFNCYDIQGRLVIIDYAHTPDGLENILKTAREMTKGKVISVFGCGGNRDKSKRSVMGEISSLLADFTILTTDNPRYENPKIIIKDIEKGIKNRKYKVVLNRTKAIQKAIKIAKKDDIVVIAGKGAENYLDIKGEKIPYSDEEVVKKIK